MNYWSWLLYNKAGKSGIRRFVDGWLVLHLTVGFTLAWLVPVELQIAANSVLLPLAGIFIGLCFAWGGNANALLQTEEIQRVSEEHPGGLREYVFVYQTAILVVLTTLCLWGLAGLGFLREYIPPNSALSLSARTFVFFLSSLTIRECWHVVLGAQSMLLVKSEIRTAERKNS
ncbi:MAG: hypothetical protein AB7O54_00745 [Pseudomonadales bacterium]